MPVHISVNAQERLSRVVLTGRISGEEIMAACLELHSTPFSGPTPDEIWDFTGARVSLGPSDLADILSTVQKVAREPGPCRVALVSTAPDLHMIADVLNARLGPCGRPYAATASLDEALRWVKA